VVNIFGIVQYNTAIYTCTLYIYIYNIIPYPHEKGPMGGAPYIGPKGGGDTPGISITVRREREPR
jgi:hypothetical protein